MTSQAFYRKWRSQRFADLVGQEPVARTLKNAVRGERIAHAYLFCGPRGVGKTSVARILAKAVNCPNAVEGEPCAACAQCLAIGEGRAIDVVELADASGVTLVGMLRPGRFVVYTRPWRVTTSPENSDLPPASTSAHCPEAAPVVE